MVLLYTLILCMVSLPTSLPRHLLVETADKGGDDYQGLPPPRPPPFYDYVMEKQNKGKLFMIPWSFISIVTVTVDSRDIL